jgi:ABC-type Fe3+/spermidine/putrescine transport system ATPase subunit
VSRIEGVSRRFGRTTAVDGVSLDIDSGDFLVLLGPSPHLSVERNIGFPLRARRLPPPTPVPA